MPMGRGERMRDWGWALFVAALVVAGLAGARAQEADTGTAKSQESAGFAAAGIGASPAKPAQISDEDIAQWLAKAEDQLARLALTAPPGDNAY